MEGDCIVINGVKYIPESVDKASCEDCCLNDDIIYCERICYVFENIYNNNKYVILKKDGNN